METREEFIARVVRQAKLESDYSAICIDDLEEYYPNDFEEAVAMALVNTAYWEGDF